MAAILGPARVLFCIVPCRALCLLIIDTHLAGAPGDVGYEVGKGYSINVPLKDGVNDEAFRMVFQRVTQEAFDRFQPAALVVQAGAASLGGDRIGTWNLTTKGHAESLLVSACFRL